MDELLDRMTPEEFDERYAADRLERVDAYRPAAMIAAQVANAATSQILARGGRAPTEMDLLETEDFLPLPSWLQQERQRSRYLTDDESLADLKRMI